MVKNQSSLWPLWLFFLNFVFRALNLFRISCLEFRILIFESLATGHKSLKSDEKNQHSKTLSTFYCHLFYCSRLIFNQTRRYVRKSAKNRTFSALFCKKTRTFCAFLHKFTQKCNFLPFYLRIWSKKSPFKPQYWISAYFNSQNISANSWKIVVNFWKF